MERFRHKLAWGALTALMLMLIAAFAGVAQGGPLDPTAPPGSTGKNVITSLPFTISQPGSYVLNGNLTCTACSGQQGITVNASNVTIDLQGFELVGAAGAMSGVWGTGSNLTVKNGTIRNWPSAGVTNNGASTTGLTIDALVVKANGIGILASSSSVARVTNCQVEGTTSPVGTLSLGPRSVVDHCVVTGNAGVGIAVGAGSVVTNTVARGNTGSEMTGASSVTFENCVADGNGTSGDGINAGHDSVVRGCTATNNGGIEIAAGNNAVLENCVADGNGTAGDSINVGVNAKIRGCTAGNSTGNEITAGDRSIVESCTADGNGLAGIGISVGNNSKVRDCTARNNGGYEISAGSFTLIENCIADGAQSGSGQGGISIGPNVVVRGCLVTRNFDFGIASVTGSLIEDNTLSNNGCGVGCIGGVWVTGANSTLRDNDFVGNGPYDIHLLGSSTGTVIQNNVLTAPTSWSCAFFPEAGAQYTLISNSNHQPSC